MVSESERARDAASTILSVTDDGTREDRTKADTGEDIHVIAPGQRNASSPCTGNLGMVIRWAKTTRPSVHSTASEKMHSERRTGFDRGKMIGRWFRAAIVLQTFLIEGALCTCKTRQFQAGIQRLQWIRTEMVERPRMAVGLTYLIISTRSVMAGPV